MKCDYENCDNDATNQIMGVGHYCQCHIGIMIATIAREMEKENKKEECNEKRDAV